MLLVPRMRCLAPPYRHSNIERFVKRSGVCRACPSPTRDLCGLDVALPLCRRLPVHLLGHLRVRVAHVEGATARASAVGRLASSVESLRGRRPRRERDESSPSDPETGADRRRRRARVRIEEGSLQAPNVAAPPMPSAADAEPFSSVSPGSLFCSAPHT